MDKFWDKENEDLSPQEIAQYTGSSVDEQVDDVLEEVYEQQPKKPVSNALLRLEQGKLYQMLIEHDLFADIDAHPQAVENVQRELKDFITSRLEIMLGLRSEKEVVRNDSVFSQIEVEALKALAKKLTEGVTKKPEEPKTGNLTPVGEKAKSLMSKMQPRPIAPIQKTVQKVAPKPQQRPQPKQTKSNKEETLEERNNRINTKKAVPESAIIKPMPNADMLTSHYQSQINSDVKTQSMVNAVLRAKTLGGF